MENNVDKTCDNCGDYYNCLGKNKYDDDACKSWTPMPIKNKIDKTKEINNLIVSEAQHIGSSLGVLAGTNISVIIEGLEKFYKFGSEWQKEQDDKRIKELEAVVNMVGKWKEFSGRTDFRVMSNKEYELLQAELAKDKELLQEAFNWIKRLRTLQCPAICEGCCPNCDIQVLAEVSQWLLKVREGK